MTPRAVSDDESLLEIPQVGGVLLRQTGASLGRRRVSVQEGVSDVAFLPEALVPALSHAVVEPAWDHTAVLGSSSTSTSPRWAQTTHPDRVVLCNPLHVLGPGLIRLASRSLAVRPASCSLLVRFPRPA